MAGDRQPERRRYFRVEDEIHLEYRPVTEPAPAGGEQPLEAMQELLVHLDTLSVQGANALPRIRKEQPELARYLSLLERKIDAIATAVASQQLGGIRAPNAHVEISGGGICFHSPEPIVVGTTLELRMALFPTLLSIRSTAKVVHCEQSPHAEGHHYIGAEFTDLSEESREALIRHTLERQSALLRQQREQK